MKNSYEEEITNTKKFLRRYKNNMSCVDRLELKLQTLDERIKSIKSPNYSGMPRGSTPVTIEELISDKMELEKRIIKLKLKGKQLRSDILDRIDLLDDSRYCEVLEAYFIDNKSITEIADEMQYTERHVYSLYKKGIEKLMKINVSD